MFQYCNTKSGYIIKTFIVSIPSSYHLSKFIIGVARLLPRALNYVERPSLGLKVVEKFGVGEEQGEEVVHVDVEVSRDHLPAGVSLPPHLIG